jgi:Fe2+ transport system protein FeoA
MVAEPGPDMRIRALTSGSTVLVDGGGRRGLGRGVRLGGAVGGCRRASVPNTRQKLVTLGCRDAANCHAKLLAGARGSTTVLEVATTNLALRWRRRRTCPRARDRR